MVESAALETSRRGDVDERVAGRLHLDAGLGRPGLIGRAINVVIERSRDRRGLPSQAGTSPPVLSRSFCSSVYRTPPVSDTRLDRLYVAWPNSARPLSQSSRTAGSESAGINRDFDLPFVVFVEEEHATDPRQLRRALHERQLLRDLVLDVRHVGRLHRAVRWHRRR